MTILNPDPAQHLTVFVNFPNGITYDSIRITAKGLEILQQAMSVRG